MSTASVTRLADRRRLVRLEARDDLALADAHDDDGLGAGRLDHLDRRVERPISRRAAGTARIVAGEVLRPDAEHDLAARSAEPVGSGAEQRQDRLCRCRCERDASGPSRRRRSRRGGNSSPASP